MHDVIDVIVWNADQNITPLLLSVELFENNMIKYAYHTRILFFESYVRIFTYDNISYAYARTLL